MTDADLEMHAPGPLARACTRLLRYLPYVGMVTIIMNDYPMFKCAQPAFNPAISRHIAADSTVACCMAAQMV